MEAYHLCNFSRHISPTPTPDPQETTHTPADYSALMALGYRVPGQSRGVAVTTHAPGPSRSSNRWHSTRRQARAFACIPCRRGPARGGRGGWPSATRPSHDSRDVPRRSHVPCVTAVTCRGDPPEAFCQVKYHQRRSCWKPWGGPVADGRPSPLATNSLRGNFAL